MKAIGTLQRILASVGASANVVFDGGAPQMNFSTCGADTRHRFTEASTKFSSSNAATFNGANGWGRDYPSNPSGGDVDLTLTCCDGSGALPGDVLQRFHVGPVDRSLASQAIPQHLDYAFRALLPMTTLAAGTYCMGLSNNNASADVCG
ncbi:MAG: hypothetical protein U1F52_17585 [Burkholderiales bacterium]